MRVPTFHTTLSIDKLHPWGACLVVVLLLTAASSAKPGRGKQSNQPLPPPEMDRNSDRFILPENHPDYVKKIVPRLNMTKRQSDPFGRSQDPDAKPVAVANANPERPRITSLQQNVPLQQVISLLKVSTVIPTENRFLINDRSFQVGDILPLSFKSKSVKVQVVSVSSSKIDFRDTGSDEAASLEMELLPPGMQPGTKISQTPGLFRNDAEAPIVLDAPGLP